MLTEIPRLHIKTCETEFAELVLGYSGISFEQLIPLRAPGTNSSDAADSLCRLNDDVRAQHDDDEGS